MASISIFNPLSLREGIKGKGRRTMAHLHPSPLPHLGRRENDIASIFLGKLKASQKEGNLVYWMKSG
jgi:hypothetical protein